MVGGVGGDEECVCDRWLNTSPLIDRLPLLQAQWSADRTPQKFLVPAQNPLLAMSKPRKRERKAHASALTSTHRPPVEVPPISFVLLQTLSLLLMCESTQNQELEDHVWPSLLFGMKGGGVSIYTNPEQRTVSLVSLKLRLHLVCRRGCTLGRSTSRVLVQVSCQEIRIAKGRLLSPISHLFNLAENMFQHSDVPPRCIASALLAQNLERLNTSVSLLSVGDLRPPHPCRVHRATWSKHSYFHRRRGSEVVEVVPVGSE